MAERLEDHRLGQAIQGGYVLEERLGAGGMGVVYRASRRGKGFAVKFLHDSYAQMEDLARRFEREVDVLRRLRHPGVVTIVDAGTERGVPFFVMELLHGQPLSSIVDAGALPPRRAIGLARQILATLAYAHDRGVVHRDLKPDNVLVLDGERDERLKVLDFGIAKVVSGTGADVSKLTATGLPLGTPSYMAPEQAMGLEADPRADVYSLGVMLYELLAGRRPFVADAPLAILRLQTDAAPCPLRELDPPIAVSRALERVVLRALEKKPAARWPDARSMSRALAATPEGGGPRRFLGATALRWGVRAAVLGLLAGAGYAGWTSLARSERRRVTRGVNEAVEDARRTLGKLPELLDDSTADAGTPSGSAPPGPRRTGDAPRRAR